jgi:hypothetical protein
MEYAELKKEFIKYNYQLTRAILDGDYKSIESLNLILNHYIAEMLDKIKFERIGAKNTEVKKAV